MNELEILNEFPIILTKNAEFVESTKQAKPGDIILLPSDAVLVVRPIVMEAKIELSKKNVDETIRKYKAHKRICSNCGKPGHRRDKCGEKEEKYKAPEEDSPILTRHQFSDIKEAQSHGMTSKDVADEMNIPIGLVNKAFGVSIFDHLKQ